MTEKIQPIFVIRIEMNGGSNYCIRCEQVITSEDEKIAIDLLNQLFW